MVSQNVSEIMFIDLLSFFSDLRELALVPEINLPGQLRSRFDLSDPKTLLKILTFRLNKYFFGFLLDWRLGSPRPNAAPSRRPQCCGGHNSLLLLEAAKAKGEESKEKRRNGKRRSNIHVCVCCFYCETLVCVNTESVAGMWYTSKPVHNLAVCWQVVYTGSVSYTHLTLPTIYSV